MFGWSVDLLKDFLPGWTLFPVGLGVLLLGFSMFDRVLPAVNGDKLEHRGGAWYASGRCSWSAAACACSRCRCRWP